MRLATGEALFVVFCDMIFVVRRSADVFCRVLAEEFSFEEIVRGFSSQRELLQKITFLYPCQTPCCPQWLRGCRWIRKATSLSTVGLVFNVRVVSLSRDNRT